MAPRKNHVTSVVTLEKRAETILANHIRPGTQRAYMKVVFRYSNFCIERQLQAFPPSPYTLRLFMASLAESCSGDTIANYVTAIRTFCRDNSIPCESIMHDYGISKSIVALKHLCVPRIRRQKCAITIPQLKEIHSKLNMSTLKHATFWAMMTVGFHGLLRLGEMAQHADTRRLLLRKHLVWHEKGVFLTIPASKTDQNYKVATIFLSETSDVTCPIVALRWMLFKEGITILGCLIRRKESPIAFGV